MSFQYISKVISKVIPKVISKVTVEVISKMISKVVSKVAATKFFVFCRKNEVLPDAQWFAVSQVEKRDSGKARERSPVAAIVASVTICDVFSSNDAAPRREG